MNTTLTLLATLGLSALGCASTKTSVRMVEDPAGEATTYGAPQNVTYVAELDAGREQMRITVYRSARCAVIPVQLMQRYKETLEGEKVVERTAISKRQIAQDAEGTIPCDQTYGRDVEVMLEVDQGRFSLGNSNSQGEVSANLSDLFKVGSAGEAPSSAKVLIRPQQAQPMVEAGTVSLAQLAKYSSRIDELIGKLELILNKEPAAVTPEDITRSYEIYAQLQEFASENPRVIALSARFWELFDGRKREEELERMGKNLQALGEAKATLKIMGDAAIPLYVQAAVNSGNLDRRALEWSSLRLLRALKGAPGVCSAGFAWAAVPSYGWPADARLAAQYVNYGYGPGHAESIQHSCSTF